MNQIDAQIESILTKSQLEVDYKNLQSLAKIAKKYSISEVAIKRRFQKFGIFFRSKARAYHCDHHIFSEESERSFYLAGFIAADGCIRIGKQNKYRNHINHRLVIALSQNDLDFLECIKKWIGCENPIGFYENKLSQRNPKWNDARIAKLSITSKQIVNDLGRYNIVPKKTFIYMMPDWLINHSLIHHFLRGYIDGDGSFWIGSDSGRKNITFSLRGTMEFLEQFKFILGKNSVHTEATPRKSGGTGQFVINSNRLVSNLCDYLYKDATIYLPRKLNIARKAKQILLLQDEYDKKIDEILNHC